MATDFKTSNLIESQLPSYLLDEGPNLVAFVKAYYEWLEQNGNATDALKNLIVNQDPDTTDLNKFFEYFKREVMSEFPTNVLANKRTLIKKIKDLYRAKGTTEAHRLLFRLLYNEEIDFFYPQESILRTSDGRWTKENSIRLGAPFVGNVDDLAAQIIVGRTSGATAKVLSVVTTVEVGITVKELFLSEVSGTFEDLEVVSNQDSTISGVITNSVGPLRNVSFPDVRFNRGGAGHVLGDRVRFASATGSGANGVVTETSDLAATIELKDGGSGYRVNNTVILVTGGDGSGLSATVTSITSPETITFYTDVIDDLKDTPIGFGPTYSSNSGSVSANLAVANAFTALNAALGTTGIVTGSINSISIVIGNYTFGLLPTVTAIDQDIADLELPDGSGGIKGSNAVLLANNITGAITAVSVDNFGIRYSAFDPVTVTNLSRTGTTAAVGNPVVSGVVENAGKYTDTKGFLSWDQKLQDSYYYQIFSYVIKSDQGIKKYRKFVNDLVHPAGTKFFGQVDIEENLDVSAFLDSEIFFQINLLGSSNGISIPSTLTIGTPQLDMIMYANSVLSTTAIGNITLGYVIDPVVSIETTAIVPNVNVLFVIGVDTSIEPTTALGDLNLKFNIDVPSISQTVISANTLLLLSGAGTVSVSNNNVITEYLGQPITSYLDSPIVTVGTPFAVIGTNTFFTLTVSGGSVIEIQDINPGLTGNTTYIVNTVFSNTSLTINTPFAGGNLVSGIYRYTYS